MKNFKRLKAQGTIIFILLMVLYTPLILGAPPSQTTTGADYLQILTPAWDVVKQSQDVDFYWHVFNLTTYLTNASVECTFHLYSIKEDGEHILSVSDVSGFNNDRDFEVKVDGGNFTESGEYRYLIECKTPKLKTESFQVGGIEEAFQVTENGKPQPEGIVIVVFIIAFLIIVGFALYEFILSIGHLASLDLDVIDLAKSIGIYFVLLGVYTLSLYYLGNSQIEGLLLIFIQVGAFTHIIIPLIGFLISITVGSLRKKKVDFGVKRIYRRQKIG